MTRKQVVLIACIAGLIMPGVVLTLYSLFGVWRIVAIGNTDLTRISWPSSVMVTVTWRNSVAGIMTTAASIAFNCIFYVAVAVLLRAGIRWFGGHIRGSESEAALTLLSVVESGLRLPQAKS